MSPTVGRQWTRQHGNLLLAVTLDPRLVGERIAAARERRGWTQLMFALEAGVSPSTIQRWEAGKLPAVRRLLEIAELLEVEPEYLVEPEEPRGDREIEALLEQLRAESDASRRALARSLQAIHKSLLRIEDQLSAEARPAREARK